MSNYPIFLDLSMKQAAVIGGGSVAFRKTVALLSSDAKVTVIANQFCDDLLSLSQTNRQLNLINSDYQQHLIESASIVIAATSNESVNRQIHDDCQSLKILCNIVDRPELCDFFVPAVAQSGRLQIAISTDGVCPAYARHLRRRLEKDFDIDCGNFLEALGEIRRRIISDIADISAKKSLLGNLCNDESFDYYIKKGPAAWSDRAENLILSHLQR